MFQAQAVLLMFTARNRALCDLNGWSSARAGRSCTMNMPVFTGETSLYKTRGHYCAMASTPTGLVCGRVLPQLPIGWCMADCDEQYPWGSIDNWACKYGCVGAGTDGGG